MAALLRRESPQGRVMMKDDMATPHELPGSIEIGDFRIDGDHLTAEMKLALCNRTETLVVFVEPHGDEIGVEVYEAVLDYLSLGVVAEHVAAKLNTVAGRALLKTASEGSKQHRRWLPQVRIRLNSSGGTSNG